MGNFRTSSTCTSSRVFMFQSVIVSTSFNTKWPLDDFFFQQTLSVVFTLSLSVVGHTINYLWLFHCFSFLQKWTEEKVRSGNNLWAITVRKLEYEYMSNVVAQCHQTRTHAHTRAYTRTHTQAHTLWKFKTIAQKQTLRWRIQPWARLSTHSFPLSWGSNGWPHTNTQTSSEHTHTGIEHPIFTSRTSQVPLLRTKD